MEIGRRRKLSRIFSILFVAILGLGLGLVISAQGAGVGFVQGRTFVSLCQNVLTCSQAFASPVTAGNVIICALAIQGDAGAQPTIGCSDTQSTVFNAIGQVCEQQAGAWNCASLFTATVLASGTDTVTTTTSTTSANGFMLPIIMEFSGILPTATSTASVTCSLGATNCGATVTMTPQITETGVDIASIQAPTTPTAPAGFTRILSNGAGGAIYASPLTTTVFPAIQLSGATSDFAAFGADFPTSTSGSASTQTVTQVIGAVGSGFTGSTAVCGYKNTATTTLVNSTIYVYQGTTVGTSVVNLISTLVASTVGSASRSVTFGLYFGSTGFAVSSAHPLVLQSQTTFTVLSGATNVVLTYAPPALSVPSNTPVAIALLASNKVKINQSSIAMSTFAGSSLPTSMFGLLSSTTQLMFCGTISYQAAVVTTTTTGGSTTSTFTSTVTQLNPNFLLSNPGNWIVMFLLLLLPVAILGGVARLGFGGAVAGLAIGTLMNFIAGIFQLWEVFFMVIVLLALVLGKRELDK